MRRTHWKINNATKAICMNNFASFPVAIIDPIVAATMGTNKRTSQSIIVANRRYAYETDDFPIANGSHGGHVEFFDPKKLPSEVANLALKTARVFNLDVCGVDILPTTDGKLLVLEANPEPDITLDRYEFPCAIAQCLIKRLEKGETRKDVICASN